MSAIHKFSQKSGLFSWDGVPYQSMNDEGIKNVTRHILIGDREGVPNFIMRYFRLEPGGQSRLERHPQEHEILILNGKGKATIGENEFDVNPFDAIYIESNELHQLRNTSSEPFGFICIIPR